MSAYEELRKEIAEKERFISELLAKCAKLKSQLREQKTVVLTKTKKDLLVSALADRLGGRIIVTEQELTASFPRKVKWDDFGGYWEII